MCKMHVAVGRTLEGGQACEACGAAVRLLGAAQAAGWPGPMRGPVGVGERSDEAWEARPEEGVAGRRGVVRRSIFEQETKLSRKRKQCKGHIKAPYRGQQIARCNNPILSLV